MTSDSDEVSGENGATSLAVRGAPVVVSLLGSLGLGMAMAYLVGLVAFLWPVGALWSAYFLQWGPWFAAVPLLALGAHLYLRMHLPGWLLDEGAPDRAVDYAEDRLDRGMWLGDRETTYLRLYRARGHIAMGDYGRARELLEEGSAPESSSGRVVLAWHRWRCELALRERDGDRCRRAFDAVEALQQPEGPRAALLACRAEQAILDEEVETYQSWLDEARWKAPAHWRVDLVEAFAATVFDRTTGSAEDALELLENVRARADREVPGRRAESRARRAALLARTGDSKSAVAELERAAADDRADERAVAVVESFRDELCATDS